MAGDPLVQESTDDPVLNRFDLPVICDDVADDNEGECCEPCADWLFCLLQTYYLVDIPGGLEMENWLADHWLSTNSQYKAGQSPLTFDNGGTIIFSGKFLAEPPSSDASAQACPLPERDDACDHTHRMRHEHTLLTSSNAGNEVKRFGLSVNTECVVVGDDKFLRFTLNLAWEAGTGDAVYEPAYSNPAVCPDKPETPYDPDSGGKAWACCPVAISDLIPLDSITSLADLASVTLNPLPPVEATYNGVSHWSFDTGPSQQCLQTTGTWVCYQCYFLELCEGGNDYFSFEINPCEMTIDGVVPDYEDPEEPEEQGEILGCTNWLNLGCGPGAEPQLNPAICVSRPIEFPSPGTITLKVIDNNCQAASGCKTCQPDPESPVVIPIQHGDVRFETESLSLSCVKVLTIVKPSCVELERVYWSDGVETIGDEGRTYNLSAADPENITEKLATLSALFVATNGCLYCYSRTFTCGCCTGLIGSVSFAEDPENPCRIIATGHISGNEDCPQAYIRYQFAGVGDCPPTFDDYDCNCLDEHPDSETPCEPDCSGALGDGDSVARTISGPTPFRYQIVDGPCGCASEWIEVLLICTPCDNCIGKIVGVQVEITGVAPNGNGCVPCEALNSIYGLVAHDTSPCCWQKIFVDAFNCEEENVTVELSVCIGCSGFGPAPNDSTVTGTIIAGGGSQHDRIIVDTDCPNVPCEDLSGDLPQTTFSNDICDFSGTTFHVEFIVA